MAEADAVTVVRRVLDACSTGDTDALAALYHPEAEIAGGILLGPGQSFSGAGALRSGIERVQERWEDFEASASVVGLGRSPDNVVVRAVVKARARDAPIGTEWISWAVLTVRDELLYRFRVFYSEDDARLAAGLSAVDG